MNNLLVSIIIPTFNRANLISETLDSILAQTYSNWECIVVDDSKTDDTQTILEQYAKNDNRFFYFKKPSNINKGPSNSRNFGFEQSQGEYIQWLDDDDLLSNNKLEVQVLKLQKINNPNVFITCDWDFFWNGKTLQKRNIFTEETKISAKNFYDTLHKHRTFVPIHSFLMSREIVLDSGLWNTKLTLNDDAEFITRILIKAVQLENTNDCFVLYRSHQNERISQLTNSEGLNSFLLSLDLMHANLKSNGIEAKKYFNWKLNNILINYGKQYIMLFRSYFSLFKENEINLKFVGFYIFRGSVSKKIANFQKKINLIKDKLKFI